jgi:hypothetical protein
VSITVDGTVDDDSPAERTVEYENAPRPDAE